MKTRMITTLALTFTLVGTACTDQFGPTEPTSAPAFSNNAGRWADWDLQSSSSDSGGESLDSYGDWADWELVLSDLIWAESEASAVIGRRGGTVTLWAVSLMGGWQPYHSITVPPGAVRRPTRFVMEVGPDAVIDVYLSATEVSSGRQITEFDKPLSLGLTFAGSSVEDPGRIRMVHLVDGAISDVVSSSLAADRRIVIGELWHFSRYALAFE